jgi:serine protease Do
MREKRAGALILLGFAALATAGISLFLFKNARPEKRQFTQRHDVLERLDIHNQQITYDTFRAIARQMNPAVVNIYTAQSRGNPLQDPSFRRFFGFGGQPHPDASGSGVVIDSEGLILTNNHVVEDAADIRVSFEAGHFSTRGVKAQVVGRDPMTDLALIRIDPQKGLAAAPLGNSDEVLVGDWVVAIGNPFNLSHTVTVGIVSAKSRTLGGVYDSFIQTDASINPGNSGGPLLNLRGEVIGINTAIVSSTGQSAGIGFAVPIQIAKQILPQLKEKGTVVRGQIGVRIQYEWNEDLAKHFGVNHGAIVTGVLDGSPADKAGIQRGDVIVEFDGKELRGSDLPTVVAAKEPGERVKLKLVRNKKEKVLSVEIAKMAARQ